MTKIKVLLAASACAGTAMWITAGLWHNLVLPGLYKDMHPHHEGLGLMLISYFILALLIAMLYTWISKGENLVVDGLKLGILIGILWVFPHGLAMAGAHSTSVAYEVKNALWHIVEQGFGGVIVALVFGKMDRGRNA